jgi:hypothetical protein
VHGDTVAVDPGHQLEVAIPPLLDDWQRAPAESTGLRIR